MKELAIVVAADEAGGIGRGGSLPWRLPGEMAYFKRLTSEAPSGSENAVLMGRRTYESIPAKFRPLPGRRNVVLTRDATYQAPGALTVHSLAEALAAVDHNPAIAQLFVVGGSEVYAQALAHPRCTRVYLTRVHAQFACDAHFPDFEADFARKASDGPHREGELTYSFELWERRRG